MSSSSAFDFSLSMPHGNPVYGILQYRIRDASRAIIPGMAKSTPIQEVVADNLKQLMGEDLTIKQLALKAGVGNGTVGRMHLGEKPCTIATLASVAKALKIHPSELLIEKLEAREPASHYQADGRIEEVMAVWQRLSKELQDDALAGMLRAAKEYEKTREKLSNSKLRLIGTSEQKGKGERNGRDENKRVSIKRHRDRA